MQALILALHEADETAAQVVQSLEQSGHNVILSKNFGHSITVLEKQHVDLIISDVHLENGGDVFDFLKWVRKNPATKDVPFVMFSCRPTKLAKYLQDAIKTTGAHFGCRNVHNYGNVRLTRISEIDKFTPSG